MKSVVVLCPYPKDEAPSQRFRFEQYWDILEENFSIRHEGFWSEKGWKVLYSKGSTLQKAIHLVLSFLKRFYIVFFVAPAYDYVFIHREVAPIFPPFFEWVLHYIFRKKIIYDFDDAIWLQNTSKQNAIVGFLKFHSKTKLICKWSKTVSVGNQFLADFAKKYCNDVRIIPTSLDTSRFSIPKKETVPHTVTLGWTGSHSTLKYLEIIRPVLEKLKDTFSFKMIVISNIPPENTLPNMEFIKWKKETEVEDLAKIDIGIMPLHDSIWAKGKCGFKALQYMSLGIPAIVSPVGVNTSIVENGKNGFWCATNEAWLEALSHLLQHPEQIPSFRQEAINTIEERFSKNALKGHYIQLFR